MTQESPARFRGAGRTAVGGRQRNEDAFVAEAPVFIVADGMGGHIGGAEAAQATVHAFRALAGGEPVAPEEVAAAHLAARGGVAQVCEDLHGDAGATLTGAIAVTHAGEPWWMVINVGDSRVYALDGGVLTQVTHDHSRVQELVDSGTISEAQALVHPDRNLLTRAIGDDYPEMDAWLVRLVPGRRLVIASDGLMKEIEDPVIGRIAALHGDPAACAEALVDAALAMAARDNVTVVVADALGATDPAADPAPWPEWPPVATEDDDTTPRTRRAS
ncbi:protein phosphatase 2C domain-containing protein [Demequina sp. SYSU T00039]|uniref:Protein phosphatase 2C domain-containing protein n=1 Tax=Demequina lignilytica TaxID=3051663 RepID=A0AAW7M7J5_9MICO|nr:MULTISPECIES: protein phosphatase 2C domain-containing protein [unclassified Demequina]MDN4477744.1 protein phosphatase 2C domain-containing protein [Demequina sp. SYSU T00039-1]MDN4487653.1 protein phosphatase 2C domain-containing protein [Demequina sp. SYSU T00039]MDN4491364.1 protein phosphatase 2C domain-containing protein [Demequina sp. SYSU T00068]